MDVLLCVCVCAGARQVYGLAHTIPRFTSAVSAEYLRPSQPIEGLYLSGQDVVCDGIVGAMFGGLLAAIAIDPLVIMDLIVTYLLYYV